MLVVKTGQQPGRKQALQQWRRWTEPIVTKAASKADWDILPQLDVRLTGEALAGLLDGAMLLWPHEAKPLEQAS